MQTPLAFESLFLSEIGLFRFRVAAAVAKPCEAVGRAFRAEGRPGPPGNERPPARSKRGRWHLIGRLELVLERYLLFGRLSYPVHLQFFVQFASQAVQCHHLRQPGFHPSRTPHAFFPAALAALPDRQRSLESRGEIVAAKQIDGFLPVLNPTALHHHRPAHGGLEPGSCLHHRVFHFSWSPSLFFFRRLSSVLRNRYESLPVSIMCAWSVRRSSMALHKRAFGNTVVHSENGRFVVTITDAFSDLPAMTWNNISAPASARATYPISSMTSSSYRVQRAVTRLSSLVCRASTSSLTISAAVVKRTRLRCRHAATARPMAKCVFPVPASPRSKTGSVRPM